MRALRLCLSAGVVLAACLTVFPARAEQGTLRIGGTGAALALMSHLGAGFSAQDAGLSVEVLPSLGSSGSIRALAGGAIDIAVSARALKPEEAAQGLEAIPLLQTPFVLVSSHTVAQAIASDRLAGLYSDPAPRWADGTPLRIILRPESDSDSAMLESSFPGMKGALAQARGRVEVPVAETDQDNIRLAGEIAGSLTAATLVQVVSEFASVTVLPVDGIAPTVESMQAGRYPYSKQLILVRRAGAGAAVDRFVEFLASPTGARLIREAGSLPLL